MEGEKSPLDERMERFVKVKLPEPAKRPTEQENLSKELIERLRQPLTEEQIERGFTVLREEWNFTNLQALLIKPWFEKELPAGKNRLDDIAPDIAENLHHLQGMNLDTKMVKRIIIGARLGGKHGEDQEQADHIADEVVLCLKSGREKYEQLKFKKENPLLPEIQEEAEAMMNRPQK